LLFFLIIAAVIFAKKSYSCRIFSLLNIEVNGLSSICMVSITFVLFQLYCGSLFWKLGILTALFMAGLCIATLIVNNLTLRAKLLPLIYFLWMIVIFILFINLGELARIKNVEYIFYLYTLACGLITGTGYPVFAKDLLKNKFETKNITAAIYSSDLIGAFLGTLICGIILIPFFGIPYSLFAILMLNAVFVLKNLAS